MTNHQANATARASLDRELASIRKQILLMGDSIDGAIDRSLQALGELDKPLARQIISDDRELNEQRFKIEEMCMAVDSLMRTRELPWRHMRDTGPRLYDLRALIDGIWLEEGDAPTCVLGMRLRCGPQGTGRPEQVTAALGVKEHPLSIHRTRLILAES